MNYWLLLPPVAFMIILGVSILVSLASSRLALKSAAHPAGKLKAYACGEDVKCHRLQPDYGQFFPFAFFFTMMHVVALIIATVPAGAIQATGIAALYVLSAVCGLFILFRK